MRRWGHARRRPARSAYTTLLGPCTSDIFCPAPAPAQLSERVWRTRLHVVGPYRKDEGVYEMTMVQRLGGRYDGYYFCESIVADGNDWKTSIISY